MILMPTNRRSGKESFHFSNVTVFVEAAGCSL